MKTIGQIAREIIIAQPELSNTQIAEMVRAQRPDAETKEASISWYRSKMKKEGVQAAAIKVEVVRTAELVQAELEEAQARVVMLQEELDSMKNEEINKKRAMLEELLKMKEEGLI